MSKIITVDENTNEKIQLVYMYEAADMLNVSKQRIHQIAKDGKIEVYNVLGLPFFKISDIEEYAKTRKVGRPAKKE